MTRRTGFSLLAALLLLGAFTPGLAQHAGLQIGVAPPQHARSTFAAVPMFILPVVQSPYYVPLVPNFPTVIVPNQVLFPGQPVFPAPIVAASPFVVPPYGVRPGVPVVVPPYGAQAGVPFVPQAVPAWPPVGTHRSEVLRRFGQPSVTIITSTGETLYFTGGVTVIIQNGQVIGPR